MLHQERAREHRTALRSRSYSYSYSFRLEGFFTFAFAFILTQGNKTNSPRCLFIGELELILSQMAQKPMLRGEVGARALRIRSDVTEEQHRPGELPTPESGTGGPKKCAKLYMAHGWPWGYPMEVYQLEERR